MDIHSENVYILFFIIQIYLTLANGISELLIFKDE